MDLSEHWTLLYLPCFMKGSKKSYFEKATQKLHGKHITKASRRIRLCVSILVHCSRKEAEV